MTIAINNANFELFWRYFEQKLFGVTYFVWGCVVILSEVILTVSRKADITTVCLDQFQALNGGETKAERRAKSTSAWTP